MKVSTFVRLLQLALQSSQHGFSRTFWNHLSVVWFPQSNFSPYLKLPDPEMCPLCFHFLSLSLEQVSDSAFRVP